ncbi:MAG: NADH-quinone oxidoreductase subunit NuoE [Phycisphaerales bacterium]
MSWTTKPSATTRIERRDEPYLTAELRRELDEKYLPRYEVRKGALLPALHLIQHHYGWIPKQAMLEIAEHLGVPPADVYDTASFYEEYWLNPKGKHLVQVCRSVACEFCGQREVTEAFKAKLGIDVGETTEDGRFTLVELECLGSCGTAPVALIDETLYENLTPDKASRLIDKVNDADAGVDG